MVVSGIPGVSFTQGSTLCTPPSHSRCPFLWASPFVGVDRSVRSCFRIPSVGTRAYAYLLTYLLIALEGARGTARVVFANLIFNFTTTSGRGLTGLLLVHFVLCRGTYFPWMFVSNPAFSGSALFLEAFLTLRALCASVLFAGMFSSFGRCGMHRFYASLRSLAMDFPVRNGNRLSPLLARWLHRGWGGALLLGPSGDLLEGRRQREAQENALLGVLRKSVGDSTV